MIELLGLPGAGKTTYAKKKLGNYTNILENNIYSDNRIRQNLNKIVFYVFLPQETQNAIYSA